MAPTLPLTLLEVAASAWGAVSVYLALKALGPARKLRGMSPPPPGTWRPFATVIVPCRGDQPGLEMNALAFARQAYPAYEVLFVVDSPDDAAAPALERARAQEPRVHIVTTQPGVGDDLPSGKMRAQFSGVALADARSEVLAFADADARPPPTWLAALAGTLEDPQVGVATGFRWYRAATKPTFWTMMRDAWDHIGVDAVMLGAMVWGGSMAVRRAEFERPEVREEMRRNIADDVAMARAFQRMGRKLRFHPGALCDSPEDGTRRGMFEFLVKEVAIMASAHPVYLKVVRRRYYYRGAAMAAGLALAVLGPTLPLRVAGLALLAPTMVVLYRAWRRDQLARRAVPSLASQPTGERWGTILLAPLVWWFSLAVFSAAARRAEVQWRGRSYALKTSAE